ncbi:MAG TPA: hypothetical protein PKC45_00465, partial [Gemmatales bacterium]|nr:hypothetical protein [Gemmatales bacterium]
GYGDGSGGPTTTDDGDETGSGSGSGWDAGNDGDDSGGTPWGWNGRRSTGWGLGGDYFRKVGREMVLVEAFFQQPRPRRG